MRHALIAGSQWDAPDDPTSFYARPLDIANEALAQGAHHPLAYLTLGEGYQTSLSSAAEREDWLLVREAFDKTLLLLGQVDGLEGLGVWTALRALSERSSAKLALGDDETYIDDMLEISDLPLGRFRPSCPDDDNP